MIVVVLDNDIWVDTDYVPRIKSPNLLVDDRCTIGAWLNGDRHGISEPRRHGRGIGQRLPQLLRGLLELVEFRRQRNQVLSSYASWIDAFEKDIKLRRR